MSKVEETFFRGGQRGKWSGERLGWRGKEVSSRWVVDAMAGRVDLTLALSQSLSSTLSDDAQIRGQSCTLAQFLDPSWYKGLHGKAAHLMVIWKQSLKKRRSRKGDTVYWSQPQ